MSVKTFSDIVAITNAGSADTESAASTLTISPNSVITEITVQDLTVGHTYAVKIDYTNCPSPQKYLVASSGAAATNGGKLVPAIARIPVRIAVPSGLSSVKVTSWADTASATVEIGIKWEIGQSGQQTFSDFGTASVGTSETLLATISVSGGIHLRQIVVASRLSVGLLKSVRLDYAGCPTPQKYSVTGMIYDAVGTEVQNTALFPVKPIDIDIVLPSNVSTVYLYATSQTASNTSAGSLVWTN